VSNKKRKLLVQKESASFGLRKEKDNQARFLYRLLVEHGVN
jgi:hypothetical protein